MVVSGPWAWWAGEILLILGLGMMAGGGIRHVRRSRTAGSARTHANAMLTELIGEGDRMWHAMHNRGEINLQRIEQWRAGVGEVLAESPFIPGASGFVLTQQGDRLSDPLDRLRQMQSNLHNWLR